jgi:hypothetical protein
MIFQTTQPHTSAPITACLRSCAVGLVNVANWISAFTAFVMGGKNVTAMGMFVLSGINRPTLAGINGNAIRCGTYKERHRYDSMGLTTS